MRIVENLQLDIALAQSGIRAKGQAMATAVHLHLYYMEQLAGLLEDIGNLGKVGEKYDLYVTIARAAPQPEAEKAIRTLKADAEIWYPENRGYDIGAFVDFLHRINLGNYDYVLKLHTKNRRYGEYGYFNGKRFSTATWSKMLVESLLGTAENVRNNYKIMSQEPKVGMLGCGYCITGEAWSYKMLESSIYAASEKMGLPPIDKFKFVAGTMFMVRAQLLKPFLQYKQENFEEASVRIRDYTLAHVLERVLGFAVMAQGYEIKGVKYKEYRLENITAEVMRFIFQQKTTKKGQKILKICKIPVWSSREPLPIRITEKEFKPNPLQHRRLAIYAAYDANGMVDKADLYYVRALRDVADNVIYVADNGLVAGEAEKIAKEVTYIKAEPHGEYDFGSYKRGLSYAETHGLLEGVDELILCNDSCYAPVHPFAPIFAEMQKEKCDFWGITENTEFYRHIQSYFIVFRPQVFNSKTFKEFFAGITVQKDVQDIIEKYEIGLSRRLAENGFIGKSYVKYPETGTYPLTLSPTLRNLTAVPLWLMQQGCPFLKKKALWLREANIERKPLRAKIYACNCNKELKAAILSSRKIIWEELKRFLFQTKTTRSGKKIVKICKIPVYSREVDKCQ